MAGTSRGSKRSRSTDSAEVIANKAKQIKLDGAIAEEAKVSHSTHGKDEGQVLTLGEGDTGQLGLGPDIMERNKPARLPLEPNFIQVAAGGMHTIAVNSRGEVYTFGCNDELALGRVTTEEDSETEPGKVELNEKVIQVSAGDSHSAGLTENGKVFIWGTFRDANGSIGLTPGGGMSQVPVQIMNDIRVMKISSGNDHLVCLAENGTIYTLGNAEQGQLGRVAECFSYRGGRQGTGLLLTPTLVSCRKRAARFTNVWTGQYTTYSIEKSGDIYAWGLNNYCQLGFSDMQIRFTPEKVKSYGKAGWLDIAGGQHHTVALDHQGRVHTLGRMEYGRLGHGDKNLHDKVHPTLVEALKDIKCVSVSCGTATSFAVTEHGELYGWGMGSSRQLSQAEDDDLFLPTLMTGKQLEKRRGLMVRAGGQHTVILAKDC